MEVDIHVGDIVEFPGHLRVGIPRAAGEGATVEDTTNGVEEQGRGIEEEDGRLSLVGLGQQKKDSEEEK